MSSKTLLHGNLSIIIKSAHKLKNVDGWGLGKSDPYVLVELDGARICRTKTVSDNLNPVWDHSLLLQLCSSYRELKFTVYDEDNFNQDDVIGTLVIPCSEFVEGKKIDKQFDLEPSKSGSLELLIKFISSDKISQSYEVPDVPFSVTKGNKVVLYQKAHIGDNQPKKESERALPFPIIVKPKFGFHALKKIIKDSIKHHHVEVPEESEYTPGNCWVDITRAIYNAKKFIYITGWSVWTALRLIRKDFPDDIPLEFAQLTLGEMLKQKASEGVRVLLLIWNEATSAFGWGGLMATHDEETHAYFQNTGVHVKLAYRKGQVSGSEFIWTHHQKSVIVDAEVPESSKRRIISFVGGLDLTDGRYDTPQHSLFRTLYSEHADDFHQVWTGVSQDLGPREPWHDIHSRLEGPIARDVLKNFVTRWRVQASNKKDLLYPITSDEFLSIQDEAELFADDPRSQWNAQFFRSIDSFSAEMVNTVELVEKSIQLAYIHNIRRAKHFIYIENQYFLGSSQSWLDNQGKDIECQNLIPVEIAEKIVSSIKKRKEFCAYILVPMYPEGIPEDNAVQEILHWQWLTMQMMYKKVHNALVEEGLLGVQKVEDYLNFYCLGKRETEVDSEAKGDSCDDPDRPKQKKLLKSRRFMVYVHSKMMIVDDEYIILGSANINERSMAGNRDTEIAVGCYQPQHVASSSMLPTGDVHAFRLSLWAAHTGVIDPIFSEPQTAKCSELVNQIAERNWQLYSQKEIVELPSNLMKYPLVVDDEGNIALRPGFEVFPDTKAKVCGGETNIPNLLTL